MLIIMFNTRPQEAAPIPIRVSDGKVHHHNICKRL